MEITKEILEAIFVCQDLALKTAGNKILMQATLLHNFVNSAIKEFGEEKEGGEIDG